MKSLIGDAARDDILRQYRYLLYEQESPLAAEQFLKSIQKSIQQICKNPDIGSPRFFSNPKLTGIRSWAVQHFPSIRIYYLVPGRVIRIVRILHGKRDIGPLLEHDQEG
ncbi:MAG TPA: type II toxin-antitoxin system RelE/ParE family toxin [Candidatus Angelobacter sp.]|nr:type II toxin-antitoxin system RelE/ParE family toxin [Candidatus Angelobacter sp.]